MPFQAMRTFAGLSPAFRGPFVKIHVSAREKDVSSYTYYIYIYIGGTLYVQVGTCLSPSYRRPFADCSFIKICSNIWQPQTPALL